MHVGVPNPDLSARPRAAFSRNVRERTNPVSLDTGPSVPSPSEAARQFRSGPV